MRGTGSSYSRSDCLDSEGFSSLWICDAPALPSPTRPRRHLPAPTRAGISCSLEILQQFVSSPVSLLDGGAPHGRGQSRQEKSHLAVKALPYLYPTLRIRCWRRFWESAGTTPPHWHVLRDSTLGKAQLHLRTTFQLYTKTWLLWSSMTKRLSCSIFSPTFNDLNLFVSSFLNYTQNVSPAFYKLLHVSHMQHSSLPLTPY